MVLTPIKIKWLQHLRYGGRTRWEKMPKTAGRRVGLASHKTWKPMTTAGLITAEFVNGRWWFQITTDGLLALEHATN